ncbi:MAG: GTP cyclohydrolase II [Anaerolineales bacterium]|nr:GTP cyclohydrolase II [Anaerolineales bacterium]
MEKISIKRLVTTRIPTNSGEFQLYLYKNNRDEKEHMALVIGKVESAENVLVRVHSECFTGEVLGSLRCDCGEQIQSAMERISSAGLGVLIYLRQEGRGIGLLDKLHAYNLQDLGYDTIDANLALGHQADERDYTIAASILHDLGILSVQLLTNNPWKLEELRQLGIPVNKRVSLQPTITPDNIDYLTSKVKRMNHLMDLQPVSSSGVRSRNGSH